MGMRELAEVGVATVIAVLFTAAVLALVMWLTRAARGTAGDPVMHHRRFAPTLARATEIAVAAILSGVLAGAIVGYAVTRMGSGGFARETAQMLLEESFQSATWADSAWVVRGHGAHQVVSDPETGMCLAITGPLTLQRDLGDELCKGRRFRLRAVVKVRGIPVIVERDAPAGGKLHLAYTDALGPHWLPGDERKRTFDERHSGWQEVDETVTVPWGAREVNLFLGVQESTGTLLLDDLRLEVLIPR